MFYRYANEVKPCAICGADTLGIFAGSPCCEDCYGSDDDDDDE